SSQGSRPSGARPSARTRCDTIGVPSSGPASPAPTTPNAPASSFRRLLGFVPREGANNSPWRKSRTQRVEVVAGDCVLLFTIQTQELWHPHPGVHHRQVLCSAHTTRM